jgi:hypothetical protein
MEENKFFAQKQGSDMEMENANNDDFNHYMESSSHENQIDQPFEMAIEQDNMNGN